MFFPPISKASPIEYQEAKIAFSPKGDALGLIVGALKGARKQVDVAMAYSHCPYFAQEAIWGVDGCGEIHFVWIYVCP